MDLAQQPLYWNASLGRLSMPAEYQQQKVPRRVDDKKVKTERKSLDFSSNSSPAPAFNRFITSYNFLLSFTNFSRPLSAVVEINERTFFHKRPRFASLRRRFYFVSYH
jgi:hypothetical protein